MILKIFSPKNLEKYGRFFRKTPTFLAKIAENFDHNIDPGMLVRSFATHYGKCDG
jgi:hypothetical protein